MRTHLLLLPLLTTLALPAEADEAAIRKNLAERLKDFPKPDEVIKTLEKIWAEQIVKSEALKKYAASRGALFAPQFGDAAQKAVFPAVQANAWLLFDGGKAKISPDTVGIPKP